MFSEGENTDSEGEEVSDEGAKYNDYDHANADDLLDLKEIANFQFSQEQFTTMLKDAHLGLIQIYSHKKCWIKHSLKEIL